MNKDRLFSMRERGLEFTDILNYRRELRAALNNPDALPWIVGYRQFQQKEWKLETLAPIDEASRLTVISYLAGIDELCKTNVSSGSAIKFRKAYLSLEGTEDRTRDSIGREIIRTGIDTGEVSYSLAIKWQSDDTRGGYQAKTQVWLPRVQGIMDRFCGPNTERLFFRVE